MAGRDDRDREAPTRAHAARMRARRITTTQSAGYHAGYAPGVVHQRRRKERRGSSDGRRNPRAESPRRALSAACPAVAPAMSTDTDARKSVDSHASHIAIDTPASGNFDSAREIAQQERPDAGDDHHRGDRLNPRPVFRCARAALGCEHPETATSEQVSASAPLLLAKVGRPLPRRRKSRIEQRRRVREARERNERDGRERDGERGEPSPRHRRVHAMWRQEKERRDGERDAAARLRPCSRRGICQATRRAAQRRARRAPAHLPRARRSACRVRRSPAGRI